MGLFGRKSKSQDPQELVHRLQDRAEAMASGHPAGLGGFGGLKDLMELASEAQHEAGPMREYAAKQQRIMTHGVDATATVRSVQPTTIAALMGGEQVHVELTITPPNGSAYDAATDLLLAPGQQERLTVGSDVPVKIDPDDPQSVMLMLGSIGYAGPGMTVVSGGATLTISAPGVQAPTAAAAGAEPASTDDPISQLEKLGAMHAAGALTDDEVAAAKRKILDG